MKVQLLVEVMIPADDLIDSTPVEELDWGMNVGFDQFDIVSWKEIS